MADSLRVERMKKYLSEEMGITSYAEILERLRKGPGINMDIFQRREEPSNDMRGSQGRGRKRVRAQAVG